MAEPVFQFQTGAVGKLFGNGVQNPLPVLRTDQPDHLALEQGLEFLGGIAQQSGQITAKARQGQISVIVAAGKAGDAAKDVFAGEFVPPFRDGGVDAFIVHMGLFPQNQQLPGGGVAEIEPQSGDAVKFRLRAALASHTEAARLSAQTVGQKLRDLPVQDILKNFPVFRIHDLLQKDPLGLFKVSAGMKGGQIGVRIVDDVENTLVQVDLRHHHVDVVQQGVVLHLGHVQGVDAGLRCWAGEGHGDMVGLGRAAVGVLGGEQGHLKADLLKAVQKLGGEDAALAAQDHVGGPVKGVGLLIDAVHGQRVVYVGETDHLGADGDIVPGQPFGIAVAVPALVVVMADVVGVAQVFLVAGAGERLQDLTAGEGMGLHDGALFRSQGSGLVEDGVGNGDLADVVEGGRAGNDADGGLVQIVFRAGAGHLIQQDAGEAADAQNVLSGFHAAVFNDGGEGVHHDLVGVTQDVGLLIQQFLQVPFVAVQIHDGLHTALGDHGVTGLHDHVICPHAEGGSLVNAGAFAQDDQQRDFRQLPVGGHVPQQGVAALAGYAQIQQERGNAVQILLQQEHSLLAGLCLQNIIIFLKDRAKLGAVFRGAAGQQ